MNASIYSRKSDKQDGNTDELSVARQIAGARAFAKARGWNIADDHVYSDSNASGAEFARRPGLVRLMAALKPRPPFDVLLVSDRDRLGREQIETSYVLKMLLQAGVRVFEVQGSGGEITLSSPTDKVLLAVTSFAGELEREQSRVRTRAALEHRARAGRSTGGRIFGYEPARTPDGHATRRIVPAEAATVRRLFTLAADGYGVKRIAYALNAAESPAPRKAGRVAGWSPSTIRGALRNELYCGIAVWSRTRKRDVWGQQRPSRRAASEVVRVDVPELRIIDEELWRRAHERRHAARALYVDRAGERAYLGGRPPSGSVSRWLLAGLGTCAACGGSMFMHARGGHRPYWRCQTRYLRGADACSNSLTVLGADVDAAVLGAVESQLLHVEVLETALAKALSVLEQDGQDAPAEALRDELRRLDDECARLAAAVARGGNLESLLGGLQEREQRRAHVRAALAARERQRRPRADASAALGVMCQALTDWQGMLHAETPAARTALQALLAGRLVFTPAGDAYTFEAPGTVEPVITGAVCRGVGSKGSGPRTRTIPPALRRALRHRDRWCRFPGCSVRFGEGHHIRHWAEGGPTTLSNLAMLCHRHHRVVHEEGYQVERRADDTLEFRTPTGRLLNDVPPPPPVPADPVGALRTTHEAQGLQIHARTGMPSWLGEPLNVAYAIDVLHPLAIVRPGVRD